MAKQRTLNEIRQSKEYQIAKETVNTQPKNPFEHEEVNKAIETIVETLQPEIFDAIFEAVNTCLLYTSPSPRDVEESRMPSSA